MKTLSKLESSIFLIAAVAVPPRGYTCLLVGMPFFCTLVLFALWHSLSPLFYIFQFVSFILFIAFISIIV